MRLVVSVSLILRNLARTIGDGLELHSALHMLARSPFARPLEWKAPQLSIHNAPIFRNLIKAAVKGDA